MAVLDAVRVEEAVVVGLSLGARVLLAWRPTTGSGARCGFVGAGPRAPGRPDPIGAAFEHERDSYDGWWRWNAHHWRRDQAGFAEFFFGEAFPEAHSTRQVEDAVAWALDTDAETLVATQSPARGSSAAAAMPPRPRRCAVRPS